ncbi:MAG: 3-hydroxybutyryl-CoA dehydrogenase, partial [Deltaproteobacteria bacterium]|nr:3-hydroxybutyryl-CoA dehydrogenase [Deltaproteobacteria bacterium]
MGLSTIGIIGAGQMGAGIAQIAAQSGLNILLNDISDEMVGRGRQGIERSLDRMIQRGRVKLDERDRIMRRIEVTTNLDDLAATDFVIEAVVENEDAKVALFQKLDRICPPRV